MKTVHEICKSIGVSRRALQHYDEIGLLPPTGRTNAQYNKYRLYDAVAVERLWNILLLQELGYKLREIKSILDNPDYDLRMSIGKQIEELTKKKERLENLIGYAQTIKLTGTVPYNFEELGDVTFEEFIASSQKVWNLNECAQGNENVAELIQTLFKGSIYEHLNSPEKEWQEEDAGQVAEKISNVVDLNKALEFQKCIDDFASLVNMDVPSDEVQEHVKKLYGYINGLFGQSMSLNGFLLWSKMLVSGGDIDAMNTKRLGQKTTDFIVRAVEIYCDKFSDEERQDKKGDVTNGR